MSFNPYYWESETYHESRRNMLKRTKIQSKNKIHDGSQSKRLKIESNGDRIHAFYNENPNIVLFQNHENEPVASIIQYSMESNNVSIKYVKKRRSISIIFNEMNMLSGKNKTDVNAKILIELQKYFYTIKRNPKLLVRAIQKDDLPKTPAMYSMQYTKIDSSNLGYRMLQSLGWNGGGLGRRNKGIEEPILPYIKIDRSGLGILYTEKLNRNIIEWLLTEYKMSNDSCDLIFGSDFTEKERRLIYRVANEYQLRPFQRNKHQIVICKDINIHELFASLRTNCDPLNTLKYDIVPPTELSS